MILSQASRSSEDPLSQVLIALGAYVGRRTRFEAAGDWALAFPALDRLKFVALLKGEQWMVLPGHEPRLMRQGDVCLIGPIPYIVASAPDVAATDGSVLYSGGNDLVRLGGDEVIGIGGSVAFTAMNADFLLHRLPPFMHVPAGSPASSSVAAVLALLDRELIRDAPGTAVIGARLADILVVEAIRAYATREGSDAGGWLAALIDPRIGRALRAMHGDIARPWTVVALAEEAAMSRAAFAAAFRHRVGSPPLEYLRHWRLAFAQAMLDTAGRNMAEIATAVGYASQSAFAYAYRKRYGVTPRASSISALRDEQVSAI